MQPRYFVPLIMVLAISAFASGFAAEEKGDRAW